MGDLYTNFKDLNKGKDVPVPRHRQYSGPIDISSIFLSKDDAMNYTNGSGDERQLSTTSYSGQVISVSEPSEKYPWRVYIVDTGNKQLIPILTEQDNIVKVTYNSKSHRVQLIRDNGEHIDNDYALIPVVIDASLDQQGRLILTLANDDKNPAAEIVVPLNGLVTKITESAINGKIYLHVTRDGGTEKLEIQRDRCIQNITVGLVESLGGTPCLILSYNYGDPAFIPIPAVTDAELLDDNETLRFTIPHLERPIDISLATLTGLVTVDDSYSDHIGFTINGYPHEIKFPKKTLTSLEQRGDHLLSLKYSDEHTEDINFGSCLVVKSTDGYYTTYTPKEIYDFIHNSEDDSPSDRSGTAVFLFDGSIYSLIEATPTWALFGGGIAGTESWTFSFIEVYETGDFERIYRHFAPNPMDAIYVEDNKLKVKRISGSTVDVLDLSAIGGSGSGDGLTPVITVEESSLNGQDIFKFSVTYTEGEVQSGETVVTNIPMPTPVPGQTPVIDIERTDLSGKPQLQISTNYSANPAQPGSIKFVDLPVPEKGVDYFTEEDIQEVASRAVDLLPASTEVVDNDNAIPTSGAVTRYSDEQRLTMLDSVGPLGASKNCLDFYDPSLIDVEFVNTLPGWEVRLIDDSNTEGNTTAGITFESGKYISRRDPRENTSFTSHEVLFSTSEDYDPNSSCQLSLCTTSALQDQQLWVESIKLTKVSSGTNSTDAVIGDALVSNSGSIYFDGYIKNGDFETGDTTGWSLHQSSVVDAIAAQAGSYGAHLKGAQNWNSMMEGTVDVVAGKTYTLSFWAKAVSGGANIKFLDNNWQGDPLAEGFWFSNTEWTQLTVTFTAISDKFYLNFCGGGPDSAVEELYVDNIQMYDCAVNDGVINGSFEDREDGWNLNHYAKIVTDSHSGKYALQISNPFAWNPTATKVVNVKANTKYIISWWAKRIEGDLPFNLIVTDSGGQNINTLIGQNWMSEVSGKWVQYACAYDSGDSTTFNLKFTSEKSDAGVIVIDDVAIEEISAKQSNVCNLDMWSSPGSQIRTNPTCIVVTPGIYEYSPRLTYLENITLEPGAQYKITLKIISYVDPDKLNWLPYTTISDRDKIALVTTGVVPSDGLQCGGPWVGPTVDSTHMLRIRIHGSDSALTKIHSIGLTGENVDIHAGYINVEPRYIFDGIDTDNHLSVKVNSLGRDYTLMRPILKSPIDLVDGSQNGSDNWNPVHTMEFLIHPIPHLIGAEGPAPLITKIAAYGVRQTNNSENLPYEIGPEKELTVKNRLTAKSIDALIDDGCLDVY